MLEAIPTATGSIDHIWCRDVLNLVMLPAALSECARVLRPGGGMLVYQTFATAELAPFEADRLYQSMAIRPPNMDPAFFEGIARRCGFVIEACDPIRSEWREHWAEAGDHSLLDDLLAVARLGRREDEFVARFGRPPSRRLAAIGSGASTRCSASSVLPPTACGGLHPRAMLGSVGTSWLVSASRWNKLRAEPHEVLSGLIRNTGNH